jgi:hypothetical protein
LPPHCPLNVCLESPFHGDNAPVETPLTQPAVSEVSLLPAFRFQTHSGSWAPALGPRQRPWSLFCVPVLTTSPRVAHRRAHDNDVKEANKTKSTAPQRLGSLQLQPQPALLSPVSALQRPASSSSTPSPPSPASAQSHFYNPDSKMGGEEMPLRVTISLIPVHHPVVKPWAAAESRNQSRGAGCSLKFHWGHAFFSFFFLQGLIHNFCLFV